MSMSTRTRAGRPVKRYSDVMSERTLGKRSRVNKNDLNAIPESECDEEVIVPKTKQSKTDASDTLKGDFLYGRTTFRNMVKYFKKEFEAVTGIKEGDSRLSAYTKREMDMHVKNFLSKKFGNLV